MTGTDFMDEIDCGSFFDQIEDFIDFPTDSINGSLNCNDFTTMWSDSPVNETDAILSGEHIQLEWLSNFFEDKTVKEDGFNNNYPIRKESPHNPFNSSSPISVLESSTAANTAITTSNSSCSGGGGGKTQRGPRSKRPRPVTFTPRSDSFAESRVPIPGDESEIKKIKKSPCSSSSSSSSSDTISHQIEVRKCMHCEITKTPQWRMGPMGPKTLCNACGVRFKSGRLFPEYRPAASPTFVPALHSNSHKKVIEMRTVAPTA